MSEITRLENYLNKVNNIEIGVSAFLGVGALLTFSTFPLLTIVASGSFPFFLDGLIGKYKKIKGESLLSKSFIEGFYKNQFNKWFDEYIDNSKSLTEKKYKLLFLAIWLKEKKINGSEMMGTRVDGLGGKDKLEELGRELMNQKECSIHISSLFYMQSSSIVAENKNVFSEIVCGDRDDLGKLEIAKKVYQEFEHLGMLGGNIDWLGDDKFNFLLNIQNFKLTKQDYENIKKITNKQSYLSSCYMSDDDEKRIQKIIANENNPENLKILKEYFEKRWANILKNNKLIDEIKMKTDMLVLEGCQEMKIKNGNNESRIKI